MSSSSTHLPTPEGPGSVSGAPNLPAGFTDTFTSRYVNAGGLRQHAVIGGAGPPLLLVHGWPENWYAWRLVMPQLARPFFAPLFTEVRGRGSLRTSPFGDSRKLDFHFTEFSKVRNPQATPKQHQR
jgi:hypothetical protein